ncbi:MAG TPA: tetratricopeptide repeat protein [Bacteroidia bacterium]|nr:tetratricopeptide repeat protein [Bacteroidia bacterium]HRS59501.1 tetratricopeptide repeat protein [Bacteroidia bacterium]HRU67607.1 tetratricopeptide repeat protein [Bacteroidia bacterium]
MDFSGNDIHKLVDFFEKQTLTDDYSFFDPDDFLKIIDFYLNISKFELAVNASKLSVRTFPFNIDLLFKRTELLMKEEEFDHALDVLDKIAMIDPFNPETHLFQAKVLFELGDFEESLEHLEHVFRYDSENIEAIKIRALIHFEVGEDTEAFDYFKAYLYYCPEDKEILRSFTYCSMNIGREDEVLKFYQKLVDHQPFSSQMWYNLGQIHDDIYRFEEAKTLYEVAAALDPENPAPYINIGAYYFAEKNYQAAIDNYLKAFERGANDSYFLSQIGYSYFYLENDELAEAYFNKSIEADKYNDNAFFGIALIAHKQQQLPKAFQMVRKAMKVDSFNPRYKVLYAIILGKMGKWKDSEDVFLKIVSSQTNEPDAFIDYLFFYYQSFHKLKALRLTEKVFEQYQKDPDITYFYIGLLFDNEMDDEAFPLLKKTLRENYDEHEIMLEYFPYLNGNPAIREIIDYYRPQMSSSQDEI